MYALITTVITLVAVAIIFPPAALVLLLLAGLAGMAATWAKLRDKSKRCGIGGRWYVQFIWNSNRFSLGSC